VSSLNLPTKPWWQTDTYDDETPVPKSLEQYAGPHGIALVRAYESGMTQAGWGLKKPEKDGETTDDGFMELYPTTAFTPRRALYGYGRGKHGFAFVMRSMRLICIDIDGKNGGLEHASELGNLPYTLSETSKSGTGYHLWYWTDEVWSDEIGFGDLPDQIGVVTGVDIRSVGCVYHWKSQRWNGREITQLPDWLKDMLVERRQKMVERAERAKKVAESGDPEELLMLQAGLLDELNRKIPQGKRNMTLYAIGCRMVAADVPNWEDLVTMRATDIGLPGDEIEKLIQNIARSV
jgi:hypothetical protein